MQLLLGLDLVMRVSFFLLLAFFTVYSIFLAYHWFTYGVSRSVSMSALCIYLIGAASAFITMSMLI